jgi:hypothetical protein
MKNWIRRPEVWVLLLASVAAALWALKSGGSEAEWEAGPGVSELKTAEARVTVLRGSLERDYGNARLDLEVKIRNEGLHPLVLVPPKVRLLAGATGDREVPPFFLPAERPPEVAGKTVSEVMLRYWLEAGDLGGPLVLELEGEKVPVKADRPYALDKLENGKAVPLRGVEW